MPTLSTASNAIRAARGSRHSSGTQTRNGMAMAMLMDRRFASHERPYALPRMTSLTMTPHVLSKRALDSTAAAATATLDHCRGHNPRPEVDRRSASPAQRGRHEAGRDRDGEPRDDLYALAGFRREEHGRDEVGRHVPHRQGERDPEGSCHVEQLRALPDESRTAKASTATISRRRFEPAIGTVMAEEEPAMNSRPSATSARLLQ